MSDNWEDWEIDELIVPVLNVPNEEQLKLFEERKLVEESDNALTKQLFSNEEEDLAYEELRKMEEKKMEKNVNVKPTEKKKNLPINNNKQKENEKKQKEMSKKIKEEKIMKQKVRETFGEAEEEYDKYAEYEDMFY